MRTFPRLILIIITTALLILLDRPIAGLPAIGRLIDPVNGCWANAEPVNKSFSADLKLSGISLETTVWIDERMAPHIHAANEHDLFFMEGYIHACFRLWQMDMETRAAAGRISEVVGKSAIKYDRKQRRKGMGYGAENSLRAMEADPVTKQMMDAYTEGINSYVATLNFRKYPLEYKIMGFAPERWTNLKTALLLKYMADDLTGKTDDIALTYLREMMPKEELDLLFPEIIPGSTPVIPAGTKFDRPSLALPVAPPDSVAFPHFKPVDFVEVNEEGKGSNNWALSGSRTASGAPILCNDPHLGLNLPSLWFEVQLQAPGLNVYGASLPGTPGVVIGFNDSLTWGFTNNYRDVKDFYLIKPVADNRNKYWFAGKQLDFTKRVEQIKVKGEPDVTDTVNYTIHGPVMYDEHYADKEGMKEMLAVCWMGHRGTNEMKAIYGMNKARTYPEFVDAILNFQCPAQNIAYADRAGNIAIWGQGQFVNKWKEQGKYVMNGGDSAALWGQLIPMRENPHVLNPQQGYVMSANQATTDSTYPYWYNGSGFVNLRAWRLNELLRDMHNATVDTMFKMQQDVYSLLAERALPGMLSKLHAKLRQPSETEKNYIDELEKWDYRLTPESKAATFFQVWWSFFYRDLWYKKLANVPNHLKPLQERSVQLVTSDYFMVYGYVDMTGGGSAEEYLWACASKSFKEAADSMRKYPVIGSAPGKDTFDKSEWYYAKNTTIAHLTKLPAFSYDHIKIGGWGNTINAAKDDHGPSWRMVVQMGKEIEAYAIYPGGQSGNPGSKHYADFLQDWTIGKYYRLLFLPNREKQDNSQIKYVWKVEGR